MKEYAYTTKNEGAIIVYRKNKVEALKEMQKKNPKLKIYLREIYVYSS